MRKRIEEIAEGRIECTGPEIEFPVSGIEIEIPEGEDFGGEFTVVSKNKEPIRGFVCSSNPRMECLTERFDGEEVCIPYQFHNAGLVEGNVETGEFFLVCSQGEYALPFTVSVARTYVRTEHGAVKTLADFSGLAEKNWQSARKLFYSPDFGNILKYCGEKENLFYKGFGQETKTDGNLEEFLLALQLKEAVSVTVSQKEYVFWGVKERIWQDTPVFKNTWGYMKLHISSDADFITPKKHWLLAEDFLGSRADFGFYLNPKKMHAGKNFGRLTLKNKNQEISIRVCASLNERDETESPVERKIQKFQATLMNTYIDYRLKKIVTGRWVSLSCKILDDLTALDPDNPWYRLLKAQALWTNGQRQEAEWILNEFKRKCRDKKSPAWGYYLYICTLTEHEEVYISRLTEEIEQIYLEHRENIMLFWCLLFLRKEYENSYQKLKALERQIMGGCDSPLLYVEVHLLFSQEPYLLRRMGDFEIRILTWARRQKVMTKSLSDQMISVFPEKLSYRKIVLSLLEEAYSLMGHTKDLLYEKTDEKSLVDDKCVLSVICGYLIRNQKHGRDFFQWYALGVKERLRITGLYEAYLLSMDARSVQEVPKIIQMYFKYNNQLGSRQKAVLYVNIIAAKERQPEAFLQNYPAMEKFAYEQMELSHIDDDLAVIYKEVLSHGIYSPQISDALSGVLFTHRLTCSWQEAVRVIVFQKETAVQTVVPIVDHAAYFPLYSNDYAILIEDRMGNRYGANVDYQLEKLMYPGKYLKTCMKHSPKKLPYLLYYFSERMAQEFFQEKDLSCFQSLMANSEVTMEYRAKLFPKMFSLMNEMNRTEDMEWELSRMDLTLIKQKDRKRILEICMDQKLYDLAWWIAGDYGFGGISPEKKVPFISYQIQKRGSAENERLLLFCMNTFLEGKYNDEMLRYLCRYYSGPVKLMKKVFFHAEKFGVCTQELAGRILVRMLYTANFSEDAGAFYKSYKDGGIRRIKEAYFTCFSYYGFTGKKAVPEGFYEELLTWQSGEEEVNEICGLALLQYYTKHPSLMEKQEKQAEALLQRYLFQGMYFSFYRKLSKNLAAKYQTYDKYFIEYRTKKDSRVWISYEKQGESAIMEEMSEAYEGIFMKKMILFFGEEVRYEILEERNGKAEKVTGGTVSFERNEDQAAKSRYARLNEMLLLREEKDERMLSEKMRRYRQLSRMTDEMFTIIR